MTETDYERPLPSDRGVCDLCEKHPCAPDDIFCATCRADTETRMDTVKDPIERLLSEHGRMEPICTEDLTICRCGLHFSGGPGYHRRHLAELICDAVGVDPIPWQFGSESESIGRFDIVTGRIIPDRARGSSC